MWHRVFKLTCLAIAISLGSLMAEPLDVVEQRMVKRIDGQLADAGELHGATARVDELGALDA